MIARIYNGLLSTDLDAAGFNLQNVAALDPVPSNLAQSNDSRLTDSRIPLDGSVTNASVANGAAIVQSKLNLNGQIPQSWLGTTATTAAQGNLAEYLSNKGVANGYASLDGGGKIPSSQIPTSVGTGTVTSVGITMPSQFAVSGSPVTGSGVLGITWNNVSDQSWFGNKEGAPAAPRFYTTALPVGLIPNLDTAKITSGKFDVARLPVAVGLGGSHAAGIVPDPGDGTGGALATDYLARDMSYKPAPTLAPTYQPTITTPVLSPSGSVTGPVMVTAKDDIEGCTFFYSFTSDSADFLEFPSTGYVTLPAGDQIWVYAARQGYTNSLVATYTNPNPP